MYFLYDLFVYVNSKNILTTTATTTIADIYFLNLTPINLFSTSFLGRVKPET